MGNRELIFAGAALLIAGVFMPIVSLPIVGNVNLFNNGSNLTALAVIALAVGAAILAAKGHERDAAWPGAGAAGILVYAFGRLQYGLSQMRDSVAKELEGNPFAGMAQAAIGTVQVQWGWLVLAAGAGLVVYAGLMVRKAPNQETGTVPSGLTRVVAGVSAFLLVGVVGWDLVERGSVGRPAEATAPVPASTTPAAEVVGPSREEGAYIAGHVQLYDLEAKYFDSMLDGRVPGVTFKLKNTGNRTLNEVQVRVEFMNAQGQAIAEEQYHPVLVSEYSFGGDNSPLRPNYIWQGEPDQFLVARSVPSEWVEGKARAFVTDIEFAPSPKG